MQRWMLCARRKPLPHRPRGPGHSHRGRVGGNPDLARQRRQRQRLRLDNDLNPTSSPSTPAAPPRAEDRKAAHWGAVSTSTLTPQDTETWASSPP